MVNISTRYLQFFTQRALINILIRSSRGGREKHLYSKAKLQVLLWYKNNEAIFLEYNRGICDFWVDVVLGGDIDVMQGADGNFL